MADSTIVSRPWKDFQDDPLPGVHADYIADCLRPLRMLDEAAFRTAVGQQRERALLVRLLQQQYALPPLSVLQPASHDAALMALSAEAWRDAAAACGLMYWSRSLAREVRGPALRQIEQRLGRAWWHWVELGLAESIEAERVPQSSATPDEPLAWPSWIQRTGQEILEAWRNDLDPGLSAWAGLKNAPGDEVTSHVRQLDHPYGKRLLLRLSTLVAIMPEAS